MASGSLGHFIHVFSKNLDQNALVRVLVDTRNDILSHFCPVADVQDPTIRIEKNLGCGKACALISLFKRVRPRDRHHQAYCEYRDVIDLVIMP